jgi:hypothetical protein
MRLSPGSSAGSSRRFNQLSRRFISSICLTALIAACMFAVGGLASGPHVRTVNRAASPPAQEEQMPALEGEAARDYLKQNGLFDQLLAAHEASRYEIGRAPSGSLPLSLNSAGETYRANNQAHSLKARFSSNQVLFEPFKGAVAFPAGAGWQFGLKLASVGYGGQQLAVGPGTLTTQANRIEYERQLESAIGYPQSAIKEWYVNRPAGIEQGFTLNEPPGMNVAGQPLRVTLSLTGDLQASLAAKGQELSLSTSAGQEVLRYAHLSAYDAMRRELPARLELDGREVSLVVEEAGALYPVTIDPTVTQQAHLQPTVGGIFGRSVAISGNTVVVGAPLDPVNAAGVNADQGDQSLIGSGAAYVFVRSGTTWSQQAYLKASTPGTNEYFGQSVAISGNTVVVGAPGDDSNARGVNGDENNHQSIDAGGAYVFVRSGTTWSQQAYLKASNTKDDFFPPRFSPYGPGFGVNPFAAEGDYFGFSVSITGDTVVVGAPNEDSQATGINGNQFNELNQGTGAAYVFVRDGTAWSQQAYLKASNTEQSQSLGASVAISGETVVVGAPGDHHPTTGVNGEGPPAALGLVSGAAYVYTRSGTTWSQQAFFKASNTGLFNRFGTSVAISGDTAVVGAPDENSESTGVNGDQSNIFGSAASKSGAAYIFVRNGTAWSQQAFLKSSNTETEDYFGTSVAVSGNTVLVVAPREDSNATGVNGNQSDNSASNAGAVYLFVRSGTSWSQDSYLKAPNTRANNVFGRDVAISGDTALAGAVGEEAHVFIVPNPPTITATSGLTRQKGSPATNSQIANVTDDGGAGLVGVTVTSGNISHGVNISNIQNNGGAITADISADCTATNGSFTLQASDGVSTSSTTLIVTVTANTAPILSYTNPPALAFNGSTTVSPATATDNGSITGYIVQSVVPALTTVPTVNSSGVVSITNAQPAGAHIITIRATDNCGIVTDASFTLTVSKGDQTITFGALANKTFGDPDFVVSPTATSGLPISLVAGGQCTVTSPAPGTVHITAAGSCTITASQAEDANYNAAPNVLQTFTINKANQTVTFNPLANKTFGDPDFGVSATASSNLTVSFSFTGSCTVTNSSPGAVHLTGGGSCTITAARAGNSNYNPAPDVARSFTINKASQTITFGVLPDKTFGAADFSVSPTSSSGMTVSLSATGNCVAGSPSPGTVHLSGSGSCTITASQAGNIDYSAAPDVQRSFNIGKAVANAAVTSSVNPSDFGQSVAFTATVTGPAGTGTPAGTIQFKDSGTNLGAPAPLNASGVAQLITSSLPTGSRTITAEYSGNANFLAGTGTLAGGQVVKPQPSLSINDVAISEGNAGTRTLNFTVTLSAASSLTVGVDYNLADGTAKSPGDYQAASGALTFNPGIATQTVSVTINGDLSFEADETFSVNLANGSNATISDNQGTGTIQNDDAQGGLVSFSNLSYNGNESAGLMTVTVVRTNDVSQAATVDYATDDTGASTNCNALLTGLAAQSCDFTTILGTLKFAAGETQKAIDIPINVDAYTEGPETFTVKLSNPTGGAQLLAPATAIVTINDSAPPAGVTNPIDDTTSFVRQQYRDFLNREADPAGLAFWKNNIDKCNDPTQRPPGQTLAQCIEVQRIITSAAFFLSIEFRQTGGLVREFYVAALNRPATNNMPNFVEFMRDTQAIQSGVIVGPGNWQQLLDANRTAFMNEFVSRAEFVGLYPTTDTPTQYVDKLYQHANVAPVTVQERLDAILEFGGATTAVDAGARGRALLRITQNTAFQSREANRKFVQFEYFGYLRRNPNGPPDNNFDGFNFWVNKLNQFNGDYLAAELVKAFIQSNGYRLRFGQ